MQQTFNTLYNRLLDLGPRDRNVATSPINYTTLFKAQINETEGEVLSLFAWPFLDLTTNLTSVASQNSYELPINCRNNQINSVNFQVSSTERYLPKPVYDASFWEYLQSLGTSASDVIQYYYIYDEKIYLYPAPSSASKTIQVRHRKIHRDMTQDDYTTGTIVSATNASATIEGTGTPAWNTGLALYSNIYLRITRTTGAKTGDGFWYEISSITDADTLVLVKPYAGTTFATGTAAYIIGEMPLIPGGFQDLLIWRPLAIYYMQNEEDQNRADRFWMMYDGGYEAGRSLRGGGLLGRMMEAYSGTTEGIYLDKLPSSEVDASDLIIRNRGYAGEGW